MRIAKLIKYSDAEKLDRFSLIKERLKKTKKNNPNYKVSSVKIEDLNYFLVIECKDVSEEFGFNNQNGVSFAFFSGKDSHKKFINHIRKKNSQPQYFKKIGLLYEITGCYLIATTKTDRKKVSIYKSSNTISCKLDINDLPKQIEKMCDEFEEYQMHKQRNRYFDMDEMFGFQFGERENIIQQILSGIISAEPPMQNRYPDYDLSKFSQSSSKTNVEQIIENKMDEIYDISFLNQVMDSAIKSENFELCAKIRDRISELNQVR